MTFSIVARCAETGMFGVAISSSSPAVAARCAYTRAGAGAVASQNVTDPRLGPQTLDLLAEGAAAEEAVHRIREAIEPAHRPYRQVLAIGASGAPAIYSGEKALGVWAEATGVDAAAGGNLLASPDVPQAMLDGFAAAAGPLGDRLLAAMRAGLAAGGEAGPVHSAGLQLAGAAPWPVADLRCDWTEGCPIETVATAWDIYKPQLDAYVQRALDPAAAPSYGVPGDE